MRLRNIPGADEVIRNCDWVIKEPADKKGKWNTVFGNENHDKSRADTIIKKEEEKCSQINVPNRRVSTEK